MKLFIIRHGDPDYAHDTLTERGVKEAELLKDRLLRDNISKVYCSPCGRAQETARPFLEATGLPCTTYDFLQEFCVPVVENGKETCAWCISSDTYVKSKTQFEDREDWFNNEIYERHNLIEHAKNVWKGFDGLLAENGYVKNGHFYDIKEGADTEQNIAIFCHEGLGLLLLSYLANVPASQMWHYFKIQPTGVTTVLFRGDTRSRAQIYGIGDLTHLATMELLYKS